VRSAIPRRLGATFAVEIDGLANQMNTQWLMIQQRFGKSITTEFIKESKVGDSFIQYTYLAHVRQQWLVDAVSWDDGVQQLFD
jgi:hypothetical protein